MSQKKYRFTRINSYMKNSHEKLNDICEIRKKSTSKVKADLIDSLGTKNKHSSDILFNLDKYEHDQTKFSEYN